MENESRSMNKFLYLIRQYLAASFHFFAKRNWRDAVFLEQYLDVLSTGPLSATDNKIPDGLRYHLLDIYVDELDKIDLKREGLMPINDILMPIKQLERQSTTKAIRVRAQEVLQDERLASWGGISIPHEKTQMGLQRNGEYTGEKVDMDIDNEWDGIGD